MFGEKRSKAQIMEDQIRTDPNMVRMYGTPEMQPRTTVGIQREMRENRKKSLMIVYVIIIIIGLLGLSFALLDDAGIKKFRETADKADCVVTRVVESGNSDMIYVTFEYNREMKMNVYAGKAAKGQYSSGDEITVYISRANPNNVMMDILGRFLWLRNISLALIVLGIILISIHIYRKKLRNSKV